jgi:hypothetical protein
MGLTSTSLLMLTRRRDFFLLDDADLPPLCNDNALEWHRERAPVHERGDARRETQNVRSMLWIKKAFERKDMRQR